jgi:hypothetical protein
MANRELLQRIEVGISGAASIELTNIPQTYTDLQLVVSGRTNGSNPGYYVLSYRVQFNGSTANYSGKTLGGAGGTAFSFSTSDSMLGGWIPNVAATANTFGNTSITIPNYTSNNYKSFSVDNVSESNNTTEVYMSAKAGLWSNASPISSISLIPESGSWVQYSSASLYGIKRGSDGATSGVATGGTITTSGGYTYHTFTSSGTFTVNKNLSVDALVIAGGGAGGIGAASFGGGGGAGGYRTTLDTAPLLLAPGSYACAVGAGGTGVGNRANQPTSGNNSSIASISATGGGYGGNEMSYTKGFNGGSSGGANYDSVAYAGNLGGYTPIEGYAGANGYNTSSSGGGGGAGQAGQSSVGGNGRNTNSTWATATGTGVSGYYAGGGGSGTYPAQTPYAGGLGGGGSAGNGGAAGTANTGSGGGASNGFGGTNNPGGSGGSGIVIIRYLTPA